jgi:hypothetical protein
MLAITLPVSASAPLVRQRVELEGVEYVLDVTWNARASVWTMVLCDTDERPIRAGLQLRRGVPLLRGLADSRRPAGELVVVGRVAEPTIDSFEIGDVQLVYLTATEVAEALS